MKTYFLRVPIGRAVGDSSFNTTFIGLPVIELITESGTEGWGFSWNIGGGSELPKKMFDRYMSQRIIGQDASMRKKLIIELSNVENFGWDFRLGRSGLANMALSAVDIALWDLLCKEAGLPLWRVLGGAHDKVAAYDTDGGWLTWSAEELVSNAKEKVKRGYKAVKIKVGSEDPADDYERLGQVRAAVGNSFKIMIDANTKWDLETAARWGRRFDDFNPFWFEEPITPLDIRGHAELRKKIMTPIAVGESIHNKFTFRDYLVQGAADILQVDCTKVVGITEWLEVANLAAAFNTNVYPHTNIQQAVHVQLVAATPNASVVEDVPWLHDVWKYPAIPKDGYFEFPSSPGAGTEVRADAIDKYESEQ